MKNWYENEKKSKDMMFGFPFIFDRLPVTYFEDNDYNVSNVSNRVEEVK